jgi:hypothetical protein
VTRMSPVSAQLSQAKPLEATAAECEAWLLKVHAS